ncbi:hypothetical protein GGS23DRAFT_253547 [Durotheca rogersii]|uniref:uncharacterized protein n=1 Tax=Durotheca rogersii TaxID=419775 RepID=UPI00221FD152|nr:uncharacterized protein GGS23DRAFT_253547 [Durotheca rogersii]KAI5859900.1 hypothetical protein GGS23DRAFT_253547 [Durotheca rogersii]
MAEPGGHLGMPPPSTTQIPRSISNPGLSALGRPYPHLPHPPPLPRVELPGCVCLLIRCEEEEEEEEEAEEEEHPRLIDAVISSPPFSSLLPFPWPRPLPPRPPATYLPTYLPTYLDVLIETSNGGTDGSTPAYIRTYARPTCHLTGDSICWVGRQHRYSRLSSCLHVYRPGPDSPWPGRCHRQLLPDFVGNPRANQHMPTHLG